MRAAQINQFVSIFGINSFALGLNIRSVIAADVRSFVPVHPNPFECGINDIRSALNIAFLVGIFNTEDKISARCLGYQILIERRSQVADVHISGRAGRESGSYFHHFTFLLKIKKNNIALTIKHFGNFSKHQFCCA